MMSAVFFAALLFLPQFFQKILGDNPLEAGAGLLPMMVVFAVTSFVAGGLYERLGAKLIVTAGAVCLTAGRVPDLADRARLRLRRARAGHGRARHRRRPLLLVDHDGRGHGARPLALEPGGRPRLHVPGGGGSVGLGLTTTVFVTASEDSLQKDLSGSRLDKGEVDALHGALAGTESSAEILARFSRGAADRILELIREAFAAGMQWAFRLVAALALVGVLISVLFVGGSLLPRDEPAAEPAQPPS